MAVNRSIWRTKFAKDSFPGLPCPRCPQGKLKLVQNSLSITEPPFSKACHSLPDFEPNWVEQRFVARMECDEAKCGETVFMVGDTEEVETYLEDEAYSGFALEEVFCARGVFPAPPLFRISDGVPPSVVRQLRLAFQLFWTDIPSCVARLRTSVELMLDREKIAKEQLSKKTGKMVRLTLHERIVQFERQATGADAAESLHALRNIGNLGTHGSGVSHEALFDAVDVLEDVLLGVYEKKSIKAKIKKLNVTKGDYDGA
jgi:hypothetical protein